jgi:hypothetical protein
MKKLFLYLTVFTSIFLFSCEEVDEAKSVTEDFYSYRQSQDYDKVLTTMSEKIYDFSSEEEIRSSLEALDGSMGELNSYKSTGFNISTDNGQTVASFTYKVIYDNGVMTDSLALLKESDSYKIIYYYWKEQ